ncbi:MAG: hypothetical protein KIS76_00880 [Pyrinomonadaceae bacterium]|nr:hypothetical protein [Pyrinomonadaceae bacterium]
MRKFIEMIEKRFSSLHERNITLVEQSKEADIYRKPLVFENTYAAVSLGELVLRSGAIVEQTFGGLTAKLWDDPFEWTLPEQLTSRSKLIDHLNEVDGLRQRGFDFLVSDEDLFRTLPAPEKLKSIGELLLETIATAENYHGRAVVIDFLNRGNSEKLDFD